MIGASILGQKPTPLELALANVVPRLFGLRGFRGSHRSDPEMYCWFLSELCAAWLMIYMAFGFALLGVWGALRGLNLVGYFDIPAFGFGAGVCVIGAADCGWRAFPAWGARRRYLAAGRSLDPHARRLMTLALANDATILLQIAGGVIFALYA